MDVTAPIDGPATAAVSEAVVRIHREYLGRGPTQARTTFRDGALVVMLFDALTKAERSLVASGQAEAVLGIRKTLQRAMRDDSIAAVEEITGRRVAAFLSDNHIDPDISVEVFVLETP